MMEEMYRVSFFAAAYYADHRARGDPVASQTSGGGPDLKYLDIDIHYAFVLTDTQGYAGRVERDCVTFDKAWGKTANMMKTLVPGNSEWVAFGADLLYGDLVPGGEPRPGYGDAMDLLERRIQQTLYDLVIKTKRAQGNMKVMLWGELDEDDERMKAELKKCLQEFRVSTYVNSIDVVLARLRELFLDHEECRNGALRE
ncbi:hypothetical protein PG993_008496 [Apiospora rasikravindrae]|uniref:Uncharacterized protein n=1 Tax=Apiospora rasikravindrae TaxID=990691 RepID=A0ABR1T2C6_9PEZI